MRKNTLNLLELVHIATKEGRDAFLSASPYPVLLPRAVSIGELLRDDKDGETMQHIPAIEDDITMFEMPPVLVLRKRSDLREGQAIGIGRTPDTDLVLSDHSVSKQHATFHRVRGTHWELQDNGSKNGTWIEDLRLIPGVPVRIHSKEELRFGRIHLRFFTPEDFFAMVVTASAER